METQTFVFVLLIEGILAIPLVALAAIFAIGYLARSSRLVDQATRRAVAAQAIVAATKPAPAQPLQDRIQDLLRANGHATSLQAIMDSVKDRRVGAVLRERKDLFVQTGKETWGLLEWARGAQAAVDAVERTAQTDEAAGATADSAEETHDQVGEPSLEENMENLFNSQNKALDSKLIAEHLKVNVKRVDEALKRSPDLFVKVGKEWGLKAWAREDQ